MAEPVLEQVTAAILAKLDAIVGDSGTTRWYTPALVSRVEPAKPEDILDTVIATAGPVYGLYELEGEEVEAATGRQVDGRQQYGLLLGYPYTAPTRDQRLLDDSAYVTTHPGKIRDRMLGDVRSALLADLRVGLPQYVTNVFDGPVQHNQQRFRDGWILAELLWTTLYSYRAA